MQLTALDIQKTGKIPMNFVAGKERSGTTLLQVMLNAHPNIVAPPESRFIILLCRRYGHIKQWTEKNITDFCDELYREMRFRNRWMLNKSEIVASLMPVRQYLTYPLLCKTIFRLFAGEQKDVKLLFDKNPVYYYYLPQLEKIFPEARFIHLVRDYRANIASYKRVFNPKRSVDLAYRWVRTNMRIEERKAELKDRYITVKYETLVSEPENTMKEICSFFNVAYNGNMDKDLVKVLYPSFAEMNRPRFLEAHGSLLEPINTSHIDEWKQKLMPEEVAEAEAVAGDYGEKLYGYKKTSPVKVTIGFARMTTAKLKYYGVRQLYKIILKRLWLYYFVKHKIWKDF